MHFAFPRGISLLRKAYEESGILGFGKVIENNNPKSELQLRIAEDARDDDTVTSYSELQGAVSMESRMAEIAATLECEKISVVLLSATNVLDDIFVARYLTTHAPSVTIILQDADILFLRGAEASLEGVYVVTPYPLIPRNREWTKSMWSENSLPSLPPSQGDQGTTNAIRFLLCGGANPEMAPRWAPQTCNWRTRGYDDKTRTVRN